MTTSLFKRTAALMAGLCISGGVWAASETVRIYNWSDYMPPEIITQFEKATGIKVVYDVFDGNEVLEAKLLAGNTGFDVVVPSASPFFARQIIAGVYQPLDKSKLSNAVHLDKHLLSRLEGIDPGNKYGIPYMWGTTGIGFNVKKIKAALGEDTPIDSWDILFKPENIAKLKDCGVAMLDAPSEVLSIALNYLGKNPNSVTPEDYTNDAKNLLLKIRPYITYFHSSQYINDLANGDVCIALGWSGDVLQASKRAKEAGKGVEVAYMIPKEGTVMWFDIMGIPKDAPDTENALKFLNYIMDPKVIAEASNYVSYANGNADSIQYLNPKIAHNPGIYPPQSVEDKLYTLNIMPPAVERSITRSWITIKTGH